MKKFLILALSLVMLISTNTMVFASESDYPIMETIYEHDEFITVQNIPDLPEKPEGMENRNWIAAVFIVDGKPDTYYYMAFLTNNETYRLTSDNHFMAQIGSEWTKNIDVRGFCYDVRLIDGEYQWIETTYPSNIRLQGFTVVQLLGSEVDIYNEDGTEMVFQKAPLILGQTHLQIVTEQSLNNLLPTLGGTMKILVLCGVGLLASVMVLSLFGKVFSIFRV